MGAKGYELGFMAHHFEAVYFAKKALDAAIVATEATGRMVGCRRRDIPTPSDETTHRMRYAHHATRYVRKHYEANLELFVEESAKVAICAWVGESLADLFSPPASDAEKHAVLKLIRASVWEAALEAVSFFYTLGINERHAFRKDHDEVFTEARLALADRANVEDILGKAWHSIADIELLKKVP